MSGRHRHYDAAFKEEAVRLSHESGLKMSQLASDLGIGRSTLSIWRKELADRDLFSGSHDDRDKELMRLRRENEILKAERDLLKKAAAKHC